MESNAGIPSGCLEGCWSSCSPTLSGRKMQMGAMSKSSASCWPAVPRHTKGSCMKPKMVSCPFENMPELTEEQRENLNRLASRPDAEIDTSDIPEMTEERL